MGGETESAAESAEWIPLNRKEDFTSFGPDSPPSVLEAEFPQLMAHARDDETAVVYSPATREFGLPILDGGGSFQLIAFDPWTGKPLPASLNEKLCDVLESMGLAPAARDRPEEFRSELWWVKRGLA